MEVSREKPGGGSSKRCCLSICQAAKVPVCHSGDKVPLTFSSIASLNCCCTLFQCCFWPEIWLCSSCILSSSRSIFASNWLKLTLLPKAALSAF